ncbi:hypothetical protein ABZ379_13435 [Streptomyces canus]|uniref:hypothetical protein n=1 Tax=Streptomyces canus TaxID=58343 RepID=UPI0033CF6ECD
MTVRGPHAENSLPAPLPLRTVGDLRAALWSGYGFTDDQVSFEADLQRALEVSSEADLSAVASVIVEYRGRIRLRQGADFGTAVQEGIDLMGRLKRKPLSGDWCHVGEDDQADHPHQERPA